ncbi:cytochrome c oxidase cbb3-type subunit 3 [Shimia isoporae]|uniref:Cbb3-type cytochrome c oxidase subunit n=1 Tax=Shimia isoporae TaxID=647720 RepID=A0A4R1NJ90_9RHOB|nr:cytochrome-c oxidase, cbb3-type subunit III [Shimia isoporae]TCL08075.1 cytochrome c oxidase cbb3-type subunit 3 [Shimia isoporae]
MSKPPKKLEGDPTTTGHSWDGIEEFNNPLPKWWVWVFYITIIWGIGYTIFYPAWPGINGATQGVLGWSTRANVQADIDSFKEQLGPINAKLEAAELTEIATDPELGPYAVSAGAAVFKTWCAQCHGSGAAGAKGYPNLLDDDWLWGGDIENIYLTVKHGIRNEVDDEARYSQMPAFGDDYLEDADIDAVANFVMSLSSDPMDASVVEAGAEVFANECASCHMENGMGDPEQGAPNLANGIWLYGGTYEDIVETVTYSRFGVMPPRGGAPETAVNEALIRAVSAYVHQLGGGE